MNSDIPRLSQPNRKSILHNGIRHLSTLGGYKSTLIKKATGSGLSTGTNDLCQVIYNIFEPINLSLPLIAHNIKSMQIRAGVACAEKNKTFVNLFRMLL